MFQNYALYIFMQFRVRSSSKKSNNTDVSLIEFPTSKSVLNGQPPMNRSMAARIDHLQAALSSFQDAYRREKEANHSNSLQIQKRLDRVQYKTFSAEQDLRHLNEIKQIKPIIRQSLNISTNNDTHKNQVILLKQMVLQQKQAQKQNLKHQNAIIEQLSMKQLRTEQQFRQLLNQQRMEYQYRMNGQGEQIRQIEGHKQRKIQQQYETIKNLIANSERRIFDQVQRKFRAQMIGKDYIEQQLQSFREQLSSEHKQTLAVEAKFIRQTKQSLQNLFTLINNLKKELGDELAETQKLSVKTMQKLSMTLDIARSKSSDEVKQMASAQQEISNQLVELRNFVTSKLQQNRQFISEFEEQALQKLQKNGSMPKDASQRHSSDQGGDRFTLFQKEINQWKAITEQKNLNVFKEISNTLKTIKLEWRKENDQLTSEVAAINQSLKNMKKSGPSQLKKSMQTIITIFNNEFDVLAEQLQSLTEMISISKKQTEKSLRDQMNKQNSDTIEAIRGLINQKGKDSNIYTDKSISRSEQNMKAFATKEVKYSSQLLNQRMQKLESQMNQLEVSLKKAALLTTSQLEEYSLKMKTFNENYKDYLEEQRKEDMKKRIQLEELMRKNASNLMDICYKKSQFLVQGLKNNIQIAQMKQKVQAAQALDAAKDQLRKEAQASKQDIQKQLAAGIEKLTKERQNSEEILHQTIGQQINNAKAGLTNDIALLRTENQTKLAELSTSVANDIAGLKNETQLKIGEINAKQTQIEAELDKDMLELKNTVLGMIRDEKRLTEENIVKLRKEIDDKIVLMEKNQQARELQQNQKIANDRKQLEAMIVAATAKQETQHAQTQKKTTAFNQQMELKNKSLSDRIDEANKRLSELKISAQKDHQKSQEDRGKSIEALRLQVDQKHKALSDKIQENNKADQELKKKEGQLEAKILALSQQMELKNKGATDKIEETNKKLAQIKLQNQKEVLKSEQEKKKSIQALKLEVQQKNKVLSDKIEECNKNNQQNKTKQTQIQAKVIAINQEIQLKNKTTNDKIEETNKKISQIKLSNQKEMAKNGEDKTKSIQALKAQLQLKNKALGDKIEQANKANKTTSDKVQQINKKLAQAEKVKAEKQNSKKNQSVSKADEIEKKIAALTLDVDTKNKATNQSIQQMNKKLTDLITNNDKQKLKEGQNKKVGESSLNQLRTDLQSQIKQLSVKIQEVQDKMHKNDQQEDIATIRKSVNKLQATVFSQQAKNKAVFDRLSEDINKVSQHLTMISNELRG